MSPHGIGLSVPRPLNRDRRAVDAVVDIASGGVCAEVTRHGGRAALLEPKWLRRCR